ncbi:hypothetical protein C8R47DRAFT_98046 [Mycena vitilis]|nr:hypothetical protein C8R47DRAFT_98046 [Mycena vitilis]
MSPHSKNIIIVGGSPTGGAAVLRGLLPNLPSSKITLINPLPYGIVLRILPRKIVAETDDLLTTALIPYDDFFRDATPNAVLIEGVVVAIRPAERGGTVVLVDGTQKPYDVLVLAPGSIWEGPLNIPWTHDAVADFFRATRANFKSAQKIILAGGGPVGVEYALQIKAVWPEKKVTIVHGGTGIMNVTYPVHVREELERQLRASGVDIIFGDYIDEIPPPGPTAIRTRKGKIMETDLVIPAKGPHPRTAFVAASLGPDTLNARGQIRVRPTLQLLEHPDIFALGDVVDTDEKKQAVTAGAHALVVAANVVAYLSPGDGEFEVYTSPIVNGADA